MPGDMDKRVKQRRLRRIKGWAQEYDSYESWGSDALKAWKGHRMILLFFSFLQLFNTSHTLSSSSLLLFLFPPSLSFLSPIALFHSFLNLAFSTPSSCSEYRKTFNFHYSLFFYPNQWFMISEHASVVEWLMRPAWWAGGRGFESRPPPNLNQKPITYNNILPEIHSQALIYLRNGALCLSRKAGCTSHFLKPKSTPPKNPRQNKHI